MILIVFAAVIVITYIATLNSLSSRIGNPVFTAKQKNTLRQVRRSVAKIGLVCIILALIDIYLFFYRLWQTSSAFLASLILADIVGYIYMIIRWASGPTVYSVKVEKKLDSLSSELNEFLSKYHIDKKFQIGRTGLTVGVCQRQRQLLIYKAATALSPSQTYKALPFRSIIDCELIEDNVTIMKGGLGRAAVGAVFAGETGAIVGAATRSSSDMVNSISVRIITNDVLNPYHPISILSTPIERKGWEYRENINWLKKYTLPLLQSFTIIKNVFAQKA